MPPKVRRNPKRNCGRKRIISVESESECENDGKTMGTKCFIRRNWGKKPITDPLREEIEIMKSTIPHHLLIKFCSEKFKFKDYVHITRNSVVYSGTRYMNHLTDTIKKLKAGKFVFFSFFSSVIFPFISFYIHSKKNLYWAERNLLLSESSENDGNEHSEDNNLPSTSGYISSNIQDHSSSDQYNVRNLPSTSGHQENSHQSYPSTSVNKFEDYDDADKSYEIRK